MVSASFGFIMMSVSASMLIWLLSYSDPAMLEKITKSLSLVIPPHVLRSRDPRAILTTVLAAWLPLSAAVLVSVIEHLPAPPKAQATRLPALIDESPGAKHVSQTIRDAMVEFKFSKSDPVVAYVSKMVAIPKSELPENKRRGNSLSGDEARDLARKKHAEIAKATKAAESLNGVSGISKPLKASRIDGVDISDDAPEEKLEDPEQLIGFARLYSGSLSVGDSVYVLTPRFSPANPHASPEPQKVTVTGLYLMMGRSLETLASVSAGIVFGIAGLEGHILKSGTLCSQLEGGVNLAGVKMGSQPIVRVALEPVYPRDLEKMIHGMKLLEQSDPCAQYRVLESGEHVISTAGELHLERCLKDLRERFARCEIQAGEPIVPYRETIVSAAEMAPPKDKTLPRGTVISVTASKQITIRLRVRPLPSLVTDFLEKNVGAIRKLYSEKKAQDRSKRESSADPEGGVSDEEADDSTTNSSGLFSLLEIKENLHSILSLAKGQSEGWTDAVEKIAAFGPRRTGPNLLIDATEGGTCQKL